MASARGIVTACMIEVGHVYIQPTPLEVEADHQRHHIPAPIVPVGGLDHGIPRQQRFPIEQGCSIHFPLLQQRKRASQAFTGHALEPTPGLQRHANLIEGHHIRLQRSELVDHQLMTHVSAFMVLFEIERRPMSSLPLGEREGDGDDSALFLLPMQNSIGRRRLLAYGRASGGCKGCGSPHAHAACGGVARLRRGYSALVWNDGRGCATIAPSEVPVSSLAGSRHLTPHTLAWRCS
jgi:hypothetical protein